MRSAMGHSSQPSQTVHVQRGHHDKHEQSKRGVEDVPAEPEQHIVTMPCDGGGTGDAGHVQLQHIKSGTGHESGADHESELHP
jgi:hypothetical protein